MCTICVLYYNYLPVKLADRKRIFVLRVNRSDLGQNEPDTFHCISLRKLSGMAYSGGGGGEGWRAVITMCKLVCFISFARHT
jgi:hypothetical protein